MDVLEIIAARDLKVGRSGQLMKVCDKLRPMSFLDLGPRSSKFRNERLFLSVTSQPMNVKVFEAFVHR